MKVEYSHDTQHSMFDAFNNTKEFELKKHQECRAQLVKLYNRYWILEKSQRSAKGATGTHFKQHTIIGALQDVEAVFLQPHVQTSDDPMWENKTVYEWQFVLIPFSVDGTDNSDDLMINNFLQVYKSGSTLSQSDKDDNTVTIYDWKEFRDFSSDEIITWHLGSKGDNHHTLCDTMMNMYHAGEPHIDVILNHPFKLAEVEQHNDYGRTYFKIL